MIDPSALPAALVRAEAAVDSETARWPEASTWHPTGGQIGEAIKAGLRALAEHHTPAYPTADAYEKVCAALERHRSEEERLTTILHARRGHPDFEYETTTGHRKVFDDTRPPEGDGWERNTPEGDNGWERFDYHEEAYWRRRKPEPHEESPTPPWGPGTNTGHGHVWERPDHIKARCGGPGLCRSCDEQRLAADNGGQHS